MEWVQLAEIPIYKVFIQEVRSATGTAIVRRQRVGQSVRGTPIASFARSYRFSVPIGCLLGFANAQRQLTRAMQTSGCFFEWLTQVRAVGRAERRRGWSR